MKMHGAVSGAMHLSRIRFGRVFFEFLVPGLPDCALIASDEDHRCDEEERCTDHQNIQGMCESHGYLLAFADRYYD
jgi:hypothetical protein